MYISTRDSHFRSIIPSFARKSSSKQEGCFALKGKNTIGEHTTLWKKKKIKYFHQLGRHSQLNIIMEELKDISELEGLVYPGAQSFTQADHQTCKVGITNT